MDDAREARPGILARAAPGPATLATYQRPRLRADALSAWAVLVPQEG